LQKRQLSAQSPLLRPPRPPHRATPHSESDHSKERKMNNLHRELAPISDAAWGEIEEEATRTLKRYLGGRRVVDVPSQGGVALPGIASGHLRPIDAPAEGILAR